MSPLDSSTVLERQLLLQLGDRLRRLRKAQGLNTVEMAKRVGISRTTLSAIEAGDPGPSIGTYLRAMAVLGVCGDLALLASDALTPAPAGTAAARSRRPRPVVQVQVSADESRHQVQDLQSLALHEEAVRMVRADPALLALAQQSLERWLASGNSRSATLWREWQGILRDRQWRKILGRTRRAQELRQASPLTSILPDQVRRSVLSQVRALKKGVALGDAMPGKAAEQAKKRLRELVEDGLNSGAGRALTPKRGAQLKKQTLGDL
jgi:transcriptional regulator with XRE-family HTH domain